MALVVITGGARSGKSSAATRLAARRSLDGQAVLVAVFGQPDSDSEMAARIARHRAERPARFVTCEVAAVDAFADALDHVGLLVIDCLGTLLSLVMAESWDSGAFAAADEGLAPDYIEQVEQRFEVLLKAIIARREDTLVVTNEVGDGVVPAYAAGRFFRDTLGQSSRSLVSAADAAYLSVAGRLLDLGALPADVSWPED